MLFFLLLILDFFTLCVCVCYALANCQSNIDKPLKAHSQSQRNRAYNTAEEARKRKAAGERQALTEAHIDKRFR